MFIFIERKEKKVSDIFMHIYLAIVLNITERMNLKVSLLLL